jgi:hypothetical protein
MPYKDAAKKRSASRKYSQEYNARPEIKRRYRGHFLRRTYGITHEEYEQILSAQGGVCAICKGTFTPPHRSSKDPKRHGKTHMPVDHCHDTDRIRGILCTRCNSLVGLALNSEDILDQAKAYLKARQ